MRRPAFLLLLPLAASLVVGCGDGDETSSVSAALDQLVAPTGDARSSQLVIAYADLEAAAAANGVDRPASDADASDIAPWVAGVAVPAPGEDPAPVVVPVLEAAGLAGGTANDVRAELGWSPADVDVVAEVSSPPFTFAVVAGSVGPADLDAADDLDEIDDGLWSAGAGEDFEQDLDDTTTIRRIGAPLRLAAEDGRIALSTSTDAVAGWRGEEPETLGDDDRLAALGAALDDADALTALILSPPPDGSPRSPAELDDAPLITVSVPAVGVGWGVEDGEAAIAVAYVVADEDDADDAADQVEAAWTDGVSFRTREPIADRVVLDEVEVDGAVVVAHLRVADGVPPAVVERMLTAADVPFALNLTD